MFRRLITGTAIIVVLATGVLAGQDTGGDKAARRKSTRNATTALNPQPLPPGRRHSLRRRKHGRHHRASANKPK